MYRLDYDPFYPPPANNFNLRQIGNCKVLLKKLEIIYGMTTILMSLVEILSKKYSPEEIKWLEQKIKEGNKSGTL